MFLHLKTSEHTGKLTEILGNIKHVRITKINELCAFYISIYLRSRNVTVNIYQDFARTG